MKIGSNLVSIRYTKHDLWNSFVVDVKLILLPFRPVIFRNTTLHYTQLTIFEK
jgi:hypothetical protein